jgi:hypothetical protein
MNKRWDERGRHSLLSFLEEKVGRQLNESERRQLVSGADVKNFGILLFTHVNYRNMTWFTVVWKRLLFKLAAKHATLLWNM